MLTNLTRDTPPLKFISQQPSPHPLGPISRPPSTDRANTTRDQEAAPSTIPYLGEPSFEVHSQQTSQVLENALSGTPPSSLHRGHVSSPLQSIRDLLKEKASHPPKSFSHDLPMIPLQTALRTLHLIDGMYQFSISLLDRFPPRF